MPLPPPIPIATARILFYADSALSTFVTVPPGVGPLRRHPTTAYEFGLSILKEQIESRSFIPQYRVDVLNRNFEYAPDGTIAGHRAEPAKITPTLLSRYDQVWFFGQHLANFTEDRTTLDAGDEGGPSSELDDDEVAALATWMSAHGGGVLITGDHSNPVGAPDKLEDPSLAGSILNLGRALGHRVPRAGKLRIWIGNPGAATGVVDTSGDTEMVVMSRQEDGVPQRMATKVYEIRLGGHGFGQLRHPLFVRQTDDPLTNFLGVNIYPDHGHEGAVTTPADFTSPAPGPFPAEEWPSTPSGHQMLPETVAIGTNQLDGSPVALVAAYDGHSAGVGRIVADSTWHHYVNVNLYGFREEAPDILDEITDYYVNLITYLSPPAARLAQLRAYLHYALVTPTVREARGASASALGRQALTALRGVAAAPSLDDLARSVVHSHAALDLKRRSSGVLLPATESWLGAALHAMFREPASAWRSDEGFRRVFAVGMRRSAMDALEEGRRRHEALERLVEALASRGR